MLSKQHEPHYIINHFRIAVNAYFTGKLDAKGILVVDLFYFYIFRVYFFKISFQLHLMLFERFKTLYEKHYTKITLLICQSSKKISSQIWKITRPIRLLISPIREILNFLVLVWLFN